MRAVNPLEFLLLRQGRYVIKGASMRDRHLLRMPERETTCPLQDLFFRRTGIRMAETVSYVEFRGN
jgi:hypothetical protein